MPLPSSIYDLSTSAASNSPAGVDSIGTSLDDYLRAIQAIIKQQFSTGTQLASGSTITPQADGNFINVTGTSSITGIASTNSWNGRIVVLKFSDALTLTHSANLVLPNAANITTATNDVFSFVQESTGVWRCISAPTSVSRALAVLSIDIGHASDTTLTRASAGTLAVEGVNLLTTATGAALAGSASQAFSVAAPTSAAHAKRFDTPNMHSLSVTQGSGSLTFSGIVHPLTFRSTILTNGAVSTIISTPSNLVLPSGSTLGFVSTVQSRIIVAEMNFGGTVEYAICNIAGGLQMDETNLISTTAIGTGSNLNNVWYSTSARTSLPYKIVGVVDVVNVSGVWGTPVLVQASGGNALSTISGFGNYQTWRAFTPGVDRLIATTYYNTTSKPIAVSIMGMNYAGGGVLTVNGITVGHQAVGGVTDYNTTIFSIVPPNGSYYFSTGGGNPTYWAELR